MKPQRLILLVTVLLVIGSIAALVIWSPLVDYGFNNSPNSVVIRADLEINSGAPLKGQICQYPSVPVLRVWGDGLVFIDDFDLQSQSTSLYKGRLSEQEIEELIEFIRTQGFFGNWTPDGPSPAANYLHVGVSLKQYTYQQTFAAIPPSFYSELVEMLKPKLALFARGRAGELRIDSLNSSRKCVTPTP